MTDPTGVLERLDADGEGALERLFALLRFPSVSTDPAHDADCRRCAAWLREDLASMGFEARLEETIGKPLVIGHAGEGRPHLLVYGHYDVQPVDPLELWDHDPFDPRIEERDGRQVIAARGAADDKGQLMTVLEALRAFHTVDGGPPCRVTVLLEGEEESGGRGLADFLHTAPGEVQADLALVCDTTMWDAETPAITTRLRGMCSEEVHLRAADRDLHSGFFGNAAANPIHELAAALAALRDEKRRVTLPGFYDGVPELDGGTRREWEVLGFDVGAFLGAVGLSEPAGEQGYSALEQVWARPTCEVNGIWGGYTGKGFKTVIPSEAHAKVSFRLVGDQDPEAVRTAFRDHMRARVSRDCTVSFENHGAARAVEMATDDPAFDRAKRALSEEWGKPAPYVGVGGSIPVVGAFKRQLGLDSLMIGFSLEDDRIHSPNEKYNLESFRKGARSWARVLAALASER